MLVHSVNSKLKVLQMLLQGPGDIPDALKTFPDLQHDPNNPEEIQAQLDVLQVTG